MNTDNDPQFNENKNEFTPDKYHGGNMLQKAENTTSPYESKFPARDARGDGSFGVTGGTPLQQKEGIAPGSF